MPAKLSLSWLSVILLVLLVAAWLGVWSAVERWRADDDRLHEPREDTIQLRHAIPFLNSRLATAQGELSSLQTKLLEQRVALAGSEVSKQALVAAYPHLQKLGPSKPVGGPEPQWFAVRPETLQAYLQAGIDVAATIHLIKSLDADLDALSVRRADLEASEVDPKKDPRGASLRQSRLADASEQLDATRKKLAETRVELRRRKAQLDALAASNPSLASLPADVSPLLELPPDTVAALLQGSAQRQAAEATVRSLDAAVANRLAVVAALNGELITAQRKAARDMESQRDRWDFQRRCQILVRAFTISLLILAAAVPALWAISAKSMNWPSRLLMGGAAVVTLVVVDAYQAFQAIGGSLAAVAAALLLAAWLVRRVERRPAPPRP